MHRLSFECALQVNITHCIAEHLQYPQKVLLCPISSHSSPILPPGQRLCCFFLLPVRSLFPEFCISGIIWHVRFSLVSLPSIVLRYIQVAVHVRSCFILLLSRIPLYGRMYHCLSTQQLMDFGLFPVFSHYE